MFQKMKMHFVCENKASSLKFHQFIITQETEKSIQFYQNLNCKDNEKDRVKLQMEMKNLEITLGKTDECTRNSFNWSELMVNPGRKAFLIGIVVAVLNQFSGCFAMLYYTAKIFEEAGSTMSPNTSAIIIGAIQFFSSFITTIIVDRAGRKVTLIKCEER